MGEESEFVIYRVRQESSLLSFTFQKVRLCVYEVQDFPQRKFWSQLVRDPKLGILLHFGYVCAMKVRVYH